MNGSEHNSISYTRQILAGLKEIRTFRLSYLRKVFSLMGKREKIALLLLCLVAVSTFFWSAHNVYLNHTVAAAAEGGSFTEGIVGQPTYINPLLARSQTDLDLTEIVFSGLYKYDSNGKIIPDLAEDMPQISEDQKQYTVNLKKNVKWHNDKTFTADDVIFSFQTLQDPSFKSPYRNLWQTTVIEKLSDYSIKFTTKDISGPFIHNLTLPILPKSVWAKTDAQSFLLSKANLEAIGTGPFAIKQVTKLASGKVQSITLQPFQNYYGDKAKLSNLTFKFFDTEEDAANALHGKEIDGLGSIPLSSGQFLDTNISGMNVLHLRLPQYQVVFFNLSNKILADQNVRQALSLATNKQAIIDSVFKGNALLPIPAQVSTSTEQTAEDNEFNLEKAKSLLENNGWTIDTKTNLRTKKNIPLELTISTNNFLLNSKAAETLASQWRELNIKVNLNVLPTQTLSDNFIRPRSFDVLLFPQKFGADPDPFVFWHSSQAKDPGLNLTGLTSPDVDKLITAARTTTNQDLRQQKYMEFETYISQQVPVIYLDQTEFVYEINNNIKNIGLNTIFEPSQRFYDIANWYTDTKRVWK